MEEEEQQSQFIKDDYQLILSFLQALRKAAKDAQNIPVFAIMINPRPAVEPLLQLQTEAQTLLCNNAALFKLAQLLSNLRTHLQELEKSQGYGLRTLLRRRITNYRIYQAAYKIEAEIQNYIDRESVKNLVSVLLREDDLEDEKVKVLKELERRLLQGFDREFQELILKAKVFSLLESFLSDYSTLYSKRIREQAALAIVGLVKFNKDVFVGLVLMGPIIRALISMATSCSIQALCLLIKLIRIPLIDEIELDGEIPRIISLLSADDASVQAAAMDCVCEIAYIGRKEVVGAMIENGLIEKLVKLQRSRNGHNSISEYGRDHEHDHCNVGINGNGEICEEGVESVDNSWPFASCVARFAVQVEVGEGLDEKEKREMKAEILKRVREACVSEAEAASIVAEVLWGSSA